MSNYPSADDLEKIRHWQGSLHNLVGFLQSIWEYQTPPLRSGRDGLRGKKVYKFELHTGGWSGNEDIIEALQHTMFYILCWRRHDRGGHYYFEIQPWAMYDSKVDWGDPIKAKA